MARMEPLAEIGRAVEQFAGAETKNQVMVGSAKLKNSSQPEKVATWVKEAMERLDQLVDKETRCRIMSQCGYQCALNPAEINKVINPPEKVRHPGKVSGSGRAYAPARRQDETRRRYRLSILHPASMAPSDTLLLRADARLAGG